MASCNKLGNSAGLYFRRQQKNDSQRKKQRKKNFHGSHASRGRINHNGTLPYTAITKINPTSAYTAITKINPTPASTATTNTQRRKCRQYTKQSGNINTTMWYMFAIAAVTYNFIAVTNAEMQRTEYGQGNSYFKGFTQQNQQKKMCSLSKGNPCDMVTQQQFEVANAFSNGKENLKSLVKGQASGMSTLCENTKTQLYNTSATARESTKSLANLVNTTSKGHIQFVNKRTGQVQSESLELSQHVGNETQKAENKVQVLSEQAQNASSSMPEKFNSTTELFSNLTNGIISTAKDQLQNNNNTVTEMIENSSEDLFNRTKNIVEDKLNPTITKLNQTEEKMEDFVDNHKQFVENSINRKEELIKLTRNMSDHPTVERSRELINKTEEIMSKFEGEEEIKIIETIMFAIGNFAILLAAMQKILLRKDDKLLEQAKIKNKNEKELYTFLSKELNISPLELYNSTDDRITPIRQQIINQSCRDLIVDLEKTYERLDRI